MQLQYHTQYHTRTAWYRFTILNTTTTSPVSTTFPETNIKRTILGLIIL